MSDNNYIEVTFVFENESSFKEFVKKHCNDEYTYRKGKYIVDMTQEVKQDASAHTAVVDEVTPSASVAVAEPAPSESMF